MIDLAGLIRTIPDFPKPGIAFRDISTLISNPQGFATAVDRLAEHVAGEAFDLVAGIEARGFLFAGALAYRLDRGALMLRKPGKLPGACVGLDYALEYGVDRIEMHADAFPAGHRILLVDDLIATGGTALAAAQLLRDNGAVVDAAAFVIDLPDLGGAERLRGAGVACHTLVGFAGH